MSTFLVHGTQGIGFEGILVGKLFGCLSFEGVFWAAVMIPFATVDIKMFLVFKRPSWGGTRKGLGKSSNCGVSWVFMERQRGGGGRVRKEREDKEEEEKGAMNALVASGQVTRVAGL